MVVVIKRGSSKKEKREAWKKILQEKKQAGIDAYKYCGTLKLKEDPIALQKRWRNEWE